MLKLVFLIVLVWIPLQSMACQTTINESQIEIFKITQYRGAELSTDMVDEFYIDFWTPMKGCSLEQRKKISQMYISIAALGRLAQETKWRSIKTSLEQRKIVFDSEYEAYISVRSDWLESRGESMEKLTDEKQKLLSMIKSVINTGMIQFNGQNIVIDNDVIDQILLGLEESKKRIEMLLSVPE